MSEDSEVIRVAGWSRTPGPRSVAQGEDSAEKFCRDVVHPAFERAKQTGSILTIDMNGAAGYLPSFVEETFGGLARKYGTETVLKHLRIVYDEDPITLEDAWDYIRNPRPERRPVKPEK